MDQVKVCKAKGCETILAGKSQLFCSSKCKMRFHRSLISKVRSHSLCLYCKAPLSGSIKKKFCNDLHKSAFHKKVKKKEKVNLNCLFCEVDFIGKEGQKFCCESHRKKAYTQSRKKNKAPSLKKCLYCEEEFIGFEKKLYCSEKHRRASFLAKKVQERKFAIKPKECLYCKEEFIPRVGGNKILFCCNEHKIKYHLIAKRKDKNLLLEKTSLEGLEEKRICLYCTKEYRSNRRKKFCCNEHLLAFKEAVKSKKPISIRITPKLTIKTKKYNQILQILEKYKSHTENLTLLNSYNLIGR